MQPSPDDGDGLERRSLTGTARRRRANTNLLHAGMALHTVCQRHLARGAVGGCGPPGRVPVRGPHRENWPALQACGPSSRVGFRLQPAFSCPAGCAAGRAHPCFARWGPHGGETRTADQIHPALRGDDGRRWPHLWWLGFSRFPEEQTCSNAQGRRGPKPPKTRRPRRR